MARNDIRIRKSMMSSGRIAKHRNYGELVARHEKEVRIKRIIKATIYFLVVLFMVVLYLTVRRIQEKQNVGPKPSTSNVLNHPSVTTANSSASIQTTIR